MIKSMFLMDTHTSSHVAFKVKTRQQIADEYGISPRTLRRWLKKYNIELPNRLISPKDQQVIYDLFGNPGN